MNKLESWLPKIILAPTTAAMLVCMYGFMIWTAALSMTRSRMLPQWEFVGFDQYVRLFSNGSTANDLNHYIEVAVYGLPAEQ